MVESAGCRAGAANQRGRAPASANSLQRESNQGQEQCEDGSLPRDGARGDLARRLELRVAGMTGALLRRARPAAAERERGRKWAK
jgi:hypothetical protein